MASSSALYTPPRAPAGLDPRTMRDALTGLGYTDELLPRSVGLSDIGSLLGTDRDHISVGPADDAPLHVLLRLFYLSDPVSVEEYRRALPVGVADLMSACGLVVVRDDRVTPAVRMVPYDGILVVSDLPYDTSGSMPIDHVLGVSSGTVSLGGMTIRRPMSSVLDLCCGTGVLGLRAARHADRVVGVDVNPRALAFAAFNAALNGSGNVEWREGDLLEPVRDERFDLVVANPPFVMSPEVRFTFRDSGAPRDDLISSIVREVPGVLADDGWFVMLCNWAHIAGESWQGRLESWLDGSRCSGWVLRMETLDPASYAERWVMLTESGADVEGKRARWTEALRRHDVEAISSGFIVVRRTSSPPWFRVDDFPSNFVPPAGESIVRVFANRDFLARTDDDALLAAVLRAAPECRLDQQLVPASEHWAVAASTLRLTTGLAYTASMEGPIGDAVSRCDGTRPLRDVLERVAATLSVDRDTVMPGALRSVRSLIDRGFLVPVEP